MDGTIALLLTQDGVINGLMYALLALATVLVYSVTRVLFLPQGEFVTYGALSFAALQLGQVPGTVWALGICAFAATAFGVGGVVRSGKTRHLSRILTFNALIPAVIIGLVLWLGPRHTPVWVQIPLAVAIVVPLGPMIFTLVFRPLAHASLLVLLIVAVAVHYVLLGLGQVFFGVEGFRAQPMFDARLTVGALTFSAQYISVLVAALALMTLLYLFFGHSRLGKALRATAINPTGARLVGIRSSFSGSLAFALAAFIGAISGILLVGLTTVYYDSGFTVGLNGFVGAVIGGVASYPLAAVGAILVGLVESFGSFWLSAYKDAIVYPVLIPVLLFLSLRAGRPADEEERE